MPSKQSIRSSNDIINRLKEKNNQLDSENLNNLSQSQLVHKGFEYGVIDETEFQASIPSDNYVVKSYLWSYLDDPSHRERVRDMVPGEEMEEVTKENLLYLSRPCIVHYYKPFNVIVSKAVYWMYGSI